MRSAARKLPYQPAVDGTECKPARVGLRASAGDVIEYPCKLGAGKIRIEHESSLLDEYRFPSMRFQRLASGGGAPVLPYDCVAQRRAGMAIPYDGSLALIGNTDRGDLARADSRARDRFHRYADLRFPDFVRVVLDPPRLRKYLAEFLLRDCLDRARMIEHHRTRAGCALV